MRRKLLHVLVIAILLSMLVSVMPASARAPAPDDVAIAGPVDAVPTTSARPAIAIGAIPPSGPHLVKPRPENVEKWLLDQGAIPLNATPEQVKAAVVQYYQRFGKRSYTWISPKIQEWALKREAELGGATLGPQAIQRVTATVLAMAVDFGATETFTIPVAEGDECVTETVTFEGPLKGSIPQPGPRDNNTIWYSPTLSAQADFYKRLIFGYDGVGRIRFDLTDPVDGQPGINLTGYTVQDYYDHVAGTGNVFITGTVEGWVTVPHSEAYYGANDCETGEDGGAGVPVGQLVVDAVNVFSATHPSYYADTSPTAFWPKYDANHDGVIDTFWIIHAGMGEEAGGGAEGPFAIWSHSWDLRAFHDYAENGYKVYEGNPSTTEDDIYIQPYTMQPENSDLGVLTEEFGHNFFGFPDLYTTDAENSIGFWDNIAGGSWAGWLGGGTPVGIPLWLRMIAVCGYDADGNPIYCNWQEPMATRDYNAPAAEITIGRLERTPADVDKGVRINLPPILEEVPNKAGSGKGAYTGTGRNSIDITLDRELAIPAAAAGLLTIPSSWALEEGFDYGYVMLKDGDAGWIFLDDLDGILTEEDPNGANLGHGLTGKGEKVLRFDLSAYQGKTVALRLRYRTDIGLTEPGWWVDDIKLDGVLVDDFEGATAPETFPGWSNSDPGWYVAPTSKSFPNYYLVEWRADTKYDKMLRTAYATSYNGEEGWQVQRTPYNIPGALLYYRNAKYRSTYALVPNNYDPPSIGPKYQLLVVDMNYGPMRLSATGPYSTTVRNARNASYDAALTLQPTDPITLTQLWIGGKVVTDTWVFPSKPPVTTFNDAKGYYAGFYYGSPCPPGYVCFSNRDGSAVIPSRDIYSTRITTFDGRPMYSLYGATVSGFPLGSGNPGDENAQYGVHINLLSKTPDNARATLRFSNYRVDMVSSYAPMMSMVMPGTYTMTYQTVVANTGTEVARHVALSYTLDAALNVVNMTSVGPAGAVDLATKSWTAQQLAPGSAVTVTVVCTGTASEPGWVSSQLDAHDGQTKRGPWFFDTKLNTYRVMLPLVLR
jgi:immune inhibitor A